MKQISRIIRTASKKISPFGVTALLVFGCKMTNTPPNSRVKEIIGADDRTEITDAELLARLGQLDLGDRKCNASLIGPDLIMTVAHCVQDKATNFESFKFSTLDGKSATISAMRGASLRKDLVIYQLNRSDFESFRLKTDAQKDQNLTVAGFDPESGKALKSSCIIEEQFVQHAAMAYLCDTRPGMSGAALLRGNVMVGMHVGYLGHENRNVGLDFSGLYTGGHIGKLSGLSFEWPPKISRPTLPNISIPSVPNLSLPKIEVPKLPDLILPLEVKLEIPTLPDVSLELWAKAGRAAYPASTNHMLLKNPSRTKLTPYQRKILEPYFSVDELDGASFHFDSSLMTSIGVQGFFVDVSGTAGQTFGSNIFSKTKNEDEDCSFAAFLGHELVHARQVKAHGGLYDFGEKYFREYKKANMTYAENALEREAFALQCGILRKSCGFDIQNLPPVCH